MKTKAGFCIDIKSRINVELRAGETAIIPLGVKMGCDEFLDTRYLQLNLSRPLRAKGLTSHTNIIDLNLKDEIKIAIHNPNNETYRIKRGDEIAEIVLQGEINANNTNNTIATR